MAHEGTVGRRISRITLAALVLGAAVTALSGDAIVARSLLDSGKKAVSAKKYDEAVTLFKKAAAEDPNLLEALYWLGQAHEKLSDSASALAAYREFLTLISRKAPSPEEEKLQPLAQKRADALALASKEFQKLEERYVADLLAIARARVAGDPGAALTAANRVLEVDPKNAEALAMRNRLSESKSDDPFAGVTGWRDLVKEQAFHSDSIKYTDGVLTLDVKGGGKLRPEKAMTLATDYAGETEWRIAEAHDDAWHAGLSFGETKDGYYAVLVSKALIRVIYAKPKQRPEQIASLATHAIDPAAWHRLGFVVRGAQIEVWADGAKVIEETQGVRADFSGDASISVNAARAEFRSVRYGSFK